jgi:HlyD family secretion protein
MAVVLCIGHRNRPLFFPISMEASMKKFFFVLLGLTVSYGSAHCVYPADVSGPAAYLATDAKIVQTKKVVAVGTVEPENTIDVGARVPGTIVSVLAHHNMTVEPGTVLAQIDKQPYELRVEQQQARCKQAQADLEQAKAKVALAQSKLVKTQKGATADLEAELNYKSAQAGVAAAEAALAGEKAALKEAQLMLSYTTVSSPVKGVVIDRRVNVGQMVAGDTPISSLFLIADPARLEVWASVWEGNIGRVHPQQPVRFTVDAFPGTVFEGRVKQIRLNATMTQNVVTYTVVVAISSTAEKLLPYMTAHLEFK